MAGMQRFVTYIYAYDRGQKSGNAGYAKMEVRGNVGRMEIHLSGAESMQGDERVCFVKKQGEGFVSVMAGTIAVENGSFSVNFSTLNVMDSGMEFEAFDGIGIWGFSERMYLSFWKDIGEGTFLPEYFRENVSNEKQEEESAIIEAEEEQLHTMEIPVRNIFPNMGLEEIWENLQKNHLSVQINESVNAIQIELRDLRELPKGYWYLGNNSFLLHGFFNYHYLLFGKLPDGKWFLGVPGVFQKQERVMASIFGFPGFLSAETSGEIVAAEKEKDGQNPQINARELQPGAWYHILED